MTARDQSVIEVQTIFACTTAPGRAGVAVWRLSGPQALPALRALTGRQSWPPRRAMRASFKNPQHGRTLDDGLAIFFPAPHSFTGEDVAELHAHGGRAIQQALLTALSALPGVRLAAPGEFTRRAFENDKLDLTAAEAVQDLVDAETEAQRVQALHQLQGGLRDLYESWRRRLMTISARLEASLDFPDEDLPPDILDRQQQELDALAAEMLAHLQDAHKGERLRQGLRIAILGEPNAGKSTLLNALAGREVAIVTDTPGTTRDVLEVALDLGGYPVIIADTAGLRETQDSIEREGIRRARAVAAQAELKILLFDATRPPAPALMALRDDKTILLQNKQDLLPADSDSQYPHDSLAGMIRLKNNPGTDSYFPISAQTGFGVPEFLAELTRRVAEEFSLRAESPLPTRARHRLAVEETLASIHRAAQSPQMELRAEDLRHARDALGRITGRVDVEQILDQIFSEFCIGK